MAILMGVLWGIMTVAAMLLTGQFYIPYLLKSRQLVPEDTSHSEASSPIIAQKTTEISKTEFIDKNPKIFYILTFFTAIFVGVSGYFVYPIVSSPVNIAKITLAILVLAMVFVCDLELMIIPNLMAVILILGRIISIIFEFIFYPSIALDSLLNSVITLVISVVVLLIMSVLTKGGLGMGDVKLFSAMGFLLGMRATVAAMVFAMLVGAVFSGILLMTKKRKLKDVIPLGPCVLYGFSIALLVGMI